MQLIIQMFQNRVDAETRLVNHYYLVGSKSYTCSAQMLHKRKNVEKNNKKTKNKKQKSKKRKTYKE